MKGFVACMLAVAADAAGRDLARPLHLALSYDEEIGCRGVPHLIARLPELCAPPIGCAVGEPTGLRPVRGHKGKAAIRVSVGGRGGHSSRPDLGLNAVHGMARVLDTAIRTADALALGPTDPTFEPPTSTLQVGIVSGGRAVNVIPDSCRAARLVQATILGAPLYRSRCDRDRVMSASSTSGSGSPARHRGTALPTG
jgi:acetylornithine deacetylase